MEREPSPDMDDDFNEIYKEYTGPPGLTATTGQEKPKVNKRSHASSDEEEEPRDPNAVPTDFTSREAKVWEAKSKATERNWKKRKEEEMICKICGESGHFTQGCPSTLGANRKSQDFFERVPARENHVRALFTEKVIQKIEKDVGCKIKMDEKFIIVSGKDRLYLAKGVDAVHKVIKEEDKGSNKKGSSSSQRSRSRSPDASRVVSRMGRSEPPKSSLPSPRKTSQFQHKLGKQEKVVEDHVREDLQKLSRGSPRAYGDDGARGRSSHSKSPGRPPYASHSKSPGRPPYASRSKSPGRPPYASHSKSPAQPPYASSVSNPYDGHTQSIGSRRADDGWNIEKRGSDVNSGRKFEFPAYPQTLEELELEYKREAMELSRIRDKEEDEENYKHRESIREMRENYMKKLAIQRGMHAKQWEEFLQLDIQRRQQAARQLSLASGFGGGYGRPGYPDYDHSSGNPNYAAANLPMVSRDKYPYPVENFPTSRAHDMYGGGDFQRQRHEDYGKTYNRY
ncbi:zinc finger protein [Macleaya cordata]|uniref:Zinc finger protein n=1 Tax=Macleaya cordata TaxID=56857 RepID=A0A200R1Z2_MACCD|nr:zinc finger protein [Macleaya cordata]